MTWLAALPHILGAAAILYVPGLAIVLPARLPALATLALAPAAGIVAVAGSAILAWLAGAAWTLAWVGGATAILAVIAALVRSRRDAGRAGWRDLLPELGGVGVTALILGPPLLGAMEGPEAFSQRFDNVFHLNAIRSVVESGEGSPFSFGLVGAAGFYPAGWYDWAGLLTTLNGGQLTVAVQSITLVTLLAIWPAGIAWLATSIVPLSRAGRLALGPLAFASVSFPLSFLEWGPLYPNLLGLAFAPAVIAAGWHALARGRAPGLGLPASLGALLLGATATLLTHPNALIAAALFLLPAAAVSVAGALLSLRRGAVDGDRPAWLHGSAPWTAAVAAALVAFPALWWVAATRFGDTVREPFMSVPHVLLEVAIGTSLGKPPVLTLAAGLLLGAAAVLASRRYGILLAILALMALPYLAAATFANHGLTSLFAAPFYNDPYRTGAILAIPSIVLAAFGWDWAIRWVSQKAPAAARSPAGAAAVALALALAVVLSPGTRDALTRIEGNFALDHRSDVLTVEERALVERIGEHVPPGGVVAVNPWQGGGLVYALGERHVTQYFMPTVPNEDVALINERLRDAASDPEVCAALERQGVGYALELEDHILWSVRTVPENAGLADLGEAPGFDPIDSEGDSALYRITACD